MAVATDAARDPGAWRLSAARDARLPGATTIFDDAASARDVGPGRPRLHLRASTARRPPGARGPGVRAGARLARSSCPGPVRSRSSISPCSRPATTSCCPKHLRPNRSLRTCSAAVGIEVSYYPPLAGPEIEEHFRPNTRLVWCESPGSNTMEVQDVPAIVEAAHARGAGGARQHVGGRRVFRCLRARGRHLGPGPDEVHRRARRPAPRFGHLREPLYRRVGETLFVLGMAVRPTNARWHCGVPDAGGAARRDRTLGAGYRRGSRRGRDRARPSSRPADVSRSRVVAPRFHRLERCVLGRLRGAFSRSDVFRFVDALRLFRIGYSWGGVTSLVMPWPDPATARMLAMGSSCAAVHRAGGSGRSRADLEAALRELVGVRSRGSVVSVDPAHVEHDPDDQEQEDDESP